MLNRPCPESSRSYTGCWDRGRKKTNGFLSHSVFWRQWDPGRRMGDKKEKRKDIVKGFEDFGRDLICKKGHKTEIVQCKCWSQHRVIREKHIMQLFGTTILYRITENIRDVEPIFATTTELSEEAKMVAKELRIKVVEKKLERYPMIKCNINPSSKEKIYHLPFDQQYDRVVIGNAEGELYAETIEEAENAGFRRAFKWKGGEIQE